MPLLLVVITSHSIPASVTLLAISFFMCSRRLCLIFSCRKVASQDVRRLLRLLSEWYKAVGVCPGPNYVTTKLSENLLKNRSFSSFLVSSRFCCSYVVTDIFYQNLKIIPYNVRYCTTKLYKDKMIDETQRSVVKSKGGHPTPTVSARVRFHNYSQNVFV